MAGDSVVGPVAGAAVRLKRIAQEHAEHRRMMQQNPDMVHDEPNAVTIEPGQTKQLVWKFGRDPNFEFSCNIPGHAEQGMRGQITLQR